MRQQTPDGATTFRVLDAATGRPVAGATVQGYAVRKPTVFGMPRPFAAYRVTAGPVAVTDAAGLVTAAGPRVLFQAAGFRECHLARAALMAADGPVEVRLTRAAGPRLSPLARRAGGVGAVVPVGAK